MKNENLNVTPTEKELENAGFVRQTHDEDGHKFTYSKSMMNAIHVCFHFLHEKIYCDLFFEGKFLKHVEPTKAAINAEFEHFGEEAPQWEKVTPKFWEVWQFNEGVVLILNLENEPLSFVHLNEKAIGRDTKEEYFLKHAKKLADRLDDYCKEKYRTVEYQTCCEESIKSDSPSCGTIKAEHVKPEILQKPYSYASLKAQGKIPHDRSGINHDKIEAFGILLDIVDILNEEFKNDDANFLHCWHINKKMQVCQRFNPDEFSFEINSKEAATLLLRDNIVLINKFYGNQP